MVMTANEEGETELLSYAMQAIWLVMITKVSSLTSQGL